MMDYIHTDNSRIRHDSCEAIEVNDVNVRFRQANVANIKETFSLPLSEIIRPNSLDDYIGQRHLINDDNGSIKNFIRLGYLPSMILYGPPGVGKTTIARILSNETSYVLVELSATDSTVSDLKELLISLLNENKKRTSMAGDVAPLRVVVFIDEIHRFTKTQQDFLLPFIEAGNFVFIGATTVDPKARLRRAIISRCQMFELKPLSPLEVKEVIEKAILYENIRRKSIHKLKFMNYDKASVDVMSQYANGDTRTAINIIELLSSHYTDATCLIDDKNSNMNEYMPIILNSKFLKHTISTLTKTRSGLQDPRNALLFDDLFDYILHKNLRLQNSGNLQQQNELSVPYIKKCSLSQNPIECIRIERPSNKSLVVKIRSNSLIYTGSSSELESDVDVESDIVYDDEKFNQWNDHIYFSDDSDVEPGQVYSEDDEEVLIWDNTTISRSKFSLLQSIHCLLMLIQRGESPIYIMKRIILFFSIYIQSDNYELQKLLSLLKAIENTTTDKTKILSNCIERLVLLPHNADKDPQYLSPLEHMEQLKKFFLENLQNHKITNGDEYLVDCEVVFEKDTVDKLLKDPIESGSIQKLNIDEFETFTIESIDLKIDLEYSVGDCN